MEMLLRGGGRLLTISVLLIVLICFVLQSNGLGGLVARLYMEPCADGEGVCMSRGECNVRGGSRVGDCHLGACCQISRTCGQEATLNNTYFVNPNRTESHCNLFVRKVAHRDGVCQMRLDFQEFNIQGPNDAGHCAGDYLAFSGQNNAVPKICGYNPKQHVYLDVRGSETGISLNFTLNSVSTERRWKLRVSQIPCRSENLAPAGCLQYFDTLRGTIRSFNYVGNMSADTPTYSIEGMRYSVCFRRSCTLSVQKSGLFGLSEKASSDYEEVKEDYTDRSCFKPEKAEDIKKSYISLDNVRFCNKNFPTTYESVNPVSRIDVLMHPDESGDRNGYVGFQLEYTQRCGNRGK